MTCAMLNLCGSYTPRKLCGGRKPCPRRKICALWKMQNDTFEKSPSSTRNSPPSAEPRP